MRKYLEISTKHTRSTTVGSRSKVVLNDLLLEFIERTRLRRVRAHDMS